MGGRLHDALLAEAGDVGLRVAEGVQHLARVLADVGAKLRLFRLEVVSLPGGTVGGDGEHGVASCRATFPMATTDPAPTSA